MAKNNQKNNVSKLNFEETIKELSSIVSKIEQGQIPLQDSLEKYERGMIFSRSYKSNSQIIRNV